MTGGRTATAGAALAALLLVGGCGGGGSAPGSTGAGGTGGAGAASLAGPAGVGGLASLISGPSGSDPSTGTSTATGDPATGYPATPTGTTSGSPSESASGPTSGAPAGGLPPATATRTVAGGDLYAFETPSGNIGCALDPTEVRCDIIQRTWAPPPRPADCPLDYGQGVSLGTGAARYVCAGDTVIQQSAPVLGYDQAVRAGDLQCVSTKVFLACRNLRTGHGFSLSKDAPPPLT